MNQPINDYSKLDERWADVISVMSTHWMVAVDFGNRALFPGTPNVFHTRIRLSGPQAKVLALLMLRNIRAAETQMGMKFDLPRGVLDELGIAPEDWGG